MIAAIKAWLGREDSFLVKYVNRQVSAVTDSDTGEPCPVCLHVRLFLIPFTLGLIIGSLIFWSAQHGLQLR